MIASKPTPLDNFIGFSVWLSTFLLFIGISLEIKFVIGMPMISYGIYGLISRRIWVWGGYGAVGGFEVQSKNSLIFSILYILVGMFLSVTL